MGVGDFFIELARGIWDCIDHAFKAILNFAHHIVGFFKNPSRLKKLKEDRNLMAIAIKENLANGNYKTVNCLFNKATNKVEDEDYQEALGIESNDIDSETEQTFGDKAMIVLE